MILELILLSNKTLVELVDDLFKEFGTAYYKRVDLKLEGNQGRKLVASLKEKPLNKLIGEPIKEIDKTDGIKFILEDDSWLLFRASGTEPVLRIYAEAPDREKLEKLIEFGKNLVGG